jgi:prephenate dehydrogenase
MKQNKKIKISILGFGRFGLLLTTILSSFSKYLDIKILDHKTIKNHKKHEKELNIKFSNLKNICEDSDIIILAIPISQFKNILKKISINLKNILKKDKNKKILVIDVASVKVFSIKWMREILPKEIEILWTHPMFWPVTTKFNYEKKEYFLKNHQIVLCSSRISEEKYKIIKQFLQKLELKIIETSPENHDKQNAKTLSLVHFVGRGLIKSGVWPQEIYTPGYTDLLKILPHTTGDNEQLFFDMHNYNPYAKKIRQSFINSCEFLDERIDENDLESKKNKLDFYRKFLDKYDEDIFKSFKKRLKIVKKIGNYKKKNNLKIFDKNREKSLIKKIIKKSKLDENFVKKLYEIIFDYSKKIQK